MAESAAVIGRAKQRDVLSTISHVAYACGHGVPAELSLTLSTCSFMHALVWEMVDGSYAADVQQLRVYHHHAVPCREANAE